MSAKRHACQVCPATFPTITEHMVHVSLEHNIRRTGGTDRTRRYWSCRSCGIGHHHDGAPCTHCGQAWRGS
jgi:hypothetical protein